MSNVERKKGFFSLLRDIEFDFARTKRNYAIIVLLLAIVLLVIDLIPVLLPGDGNSQPVHQQSAERWEYWSEFIFRFIVITCLLTIVAFFIEVFENVHDLNQSAQQLEESLFQLRKNAYSVASREISRFTKRHHKETIGKFLQEWRKEVEEALVSIDDGCFKVSQEFQAIRSYEIFWRHLVEEQKNRWGHPLTVLIIHSSSFDIWSKYAISERLLRSQKSFHDMGGRATRILCAKGKPTEEIKEVAKDMNEKAGVVVHYYDISTTKVDFDFAWDFLYVKETENAVIWDSFTTGANIKDSTYQIGTHFREQDLEALWYGIERSLEDKYKNEAKWWDS